MNEPKIIKLIQENPDLPIIPMVNGEVVVDDYGYWMGKWGHCEVTEYYLGREKVHFKDDDEEYVLMDLEGCGYCKDFDGNDIYDLSGEQWDALYEKVPWAKAIVVYITV